MTVSVVGTPSVVNLSNVATATPSIANTPGTGDLVIVVVDLAASATVSSVTGLGATWSEVYFTQDIGGSGQNAATHAVWFGTGATASGNITVTLSATRYGTVRAFHVAGLTSTSVVAGSTYYAVSASPTLPGNAATTNAVGPSQTADAGQFVLNFWMTADTATTPVYPATQAPSGWTVQANYRNFISGNFNTAYRIPSSSASHQLTATTATAKGHFITQLVIGGTGGGAVPLGTGTGAFQWAGSGTGVKNPGATGSGTYAFTGAGTGQAARSGAGTGTFAWAGTGTGTTPAVGVRNGIGTGAYGWAGAGTGSALPKGTGVGDYQWAGVGVGTTPGGPGAATGTGTFGWTALGMGDNGDEQTVSCRVETPDGILVSIPLLPVEPLAEAVPITRVSVLAPNLSAEYPQHPAPGEPGAPEVVEEVVGYPQLFIGGQNVTNFRDAPTIIRRWESESPFGDTVAAFEFPQLNPWDKPGTGDLDFLARDARVAIGIREEVAPGAFRVRRLWSGFLDARGNGLGEGEDYAWEAKGTFWQAASYNREPHPITEPVDIGVWIARVMNAIEGRRWAAMPLTPIGITTMTRGHRDQTGWDYVQELLSEAITDDLRQWTMVEVAPGVPRLVLKPAPTEVHATVAYGTPGVDIDLRVDESTRVDRIFMRGIGPKMGGWANVYYPWIGLLNQAPAYPMENLTDYIVLGTTDADTVTGAGVTDFQRRVDELEGFANPAVSGVMSAAWMAVVDDLQRRLHITVGPLGPQTWERVFDDRPNPEALKPRRLPMASKSAAEMYLYNAEGKRLPGVNPEWDGRVPRDIAIDIGVGKTKAEGFKLARKLLGIYGDAAANGQIVWTTDPREIDRTRLSHLSNVKVTGFEGEDRVVQVSSKSVEYDTGGDGPLYVVTTRVDERARDAMVVEDMLNQRREAKADPSRRPGVTNRASRQVSDQRTPWDSESVCGRLRRTAVNGAAGVWTVKWVPFAEVGKLAGIRLYSDQPFAFAIFGSLRITANKLNDIVGDPFATDDVWAEKKDELDEYGIIEAWGEKDDACGYSPKVETATPGGPPAGPFNGKFILDTPVDYWTETPPAVAVAIFMRGGSGYIEGRFIPAYEP